MKQAIAYIRISDKDQSNFSLEGQEKYIRDHCSKNDINLLETFIDNGKSAKNFDRPDWIKLETFIKQHRNVNYLVVVKYDRFSRNAAQGLNKIEMLEKKFGIIIISVFEQMYIDYDSPFFFKQRADMLVNAEFEWHVIRDRTRFGMHEALSSGRYISKAPIGYLNQRDERKKPIIVLDENKAPVVYNIFNQYLQGLPFVNIAKLAAEMGVVLKGKSAIPRILANCVYAGLIHVPAYRKEPAKQVRGLHDPIITEDTYWKVQEKMGNVPRARTILNDEVHLRGVLKCECGKCFTAGESKGKSKWYWYYRCNEHPKQNFSARKLHTQFDEVLNYFSLNNLQINYLKQDVEKTLDEQLKEKTRLKVQAEREWKQAVKQLESLEEKYLNDQITHETYKRWHNTIKSKEATAKYNLDHLADNRISLWREIQASLPSLEDVKFLYHSATIDGKHSFLKQVFNWNLMYSEGAYRTPSLFSLFRHNELILKQKGLLIVERTAQNFEKTPVSAPSGTPIEHLHSLLRAIKQNKSA